MPLSTFVKLVGKAFRFTIIRPIQRFNVYNRAKKHLGPDAEQFLPAPRAIGPMANGKPKQYPHLEGGRGLFKSVRERRLEALQAKALESQSTKVKLLPPNERSFSETESDDINVIDTSKKLQVIKSITLLDSPKPKELLNEPQEQKEELNIKESRPLPKCTSLDMANPADIWNIDKVPLGKISLNQLQEIMVNKLADDNYWTPKVIAEKYNIKEEYAKELIESYKQIRIVLSPRMYKLVEYTGRNNPTFEATKHLVYHVDKSLRTDIDKQFDKMFLPTDELDPKIRELIDEPTPLPVPIKPKLTHRVEEVFNRPRVIAKKPEPLRIQPLNYSREDSKQLVASRNLLDTPEQPKILPPPAEHQKQSSNPPNEEETKQKHEKHSTN